MNNKQIILILFNELKKELLNILNFFNNRNLLIEIFIYLPE